MTARAHPLPSFETTPVIEPSAQQARQPPKENKKRRAQAWLALHFGQWPLYVSLSSFTAQQRQNMQSQPIAVLGADRQRRVLACNAAAVRQGIRPGHTLNAAIALCTELRLLERDPVRETELLKRMASWAHRYTPWVNIASENELLLEVRGSLRLFGGAAALTEKIAQVLQSHGCAASLALSATSHSALWLSRSYAGICIVPPRQLQPSLAQISVSCLQWPEDIELRLARFGVTTVGDLLRLPRPDLARRIGKDCMRELNCALGREAAMRTLFQAAETYSDGIVLDFEIESTDRLESLLSQRFDTLQQYLHRRNSAVGSLTVELLHREHAVTSLRIGLAVPTADVNHLRKLLHERLALLSLPAPVLEVRLQVKRLYSAQGVSMDFFDAAGEGAPQLLQQERLGRLLEHLQIRLGNQAIRALKTRADHRPEKAQVHVRAEIGAASAQEVPPANVPKRPLWLLKEPRYLSSRSEFPEAMRWVSGPERIETGWWDQQPIHRDYYVAKNHANVLCWIFKERQPPHEWRLHGLFG